MTGGEVEQTVREVAARLGVADFVYLPTLVSKAQSNREVSDGLLLCRQGGAVIEVKTRDPQAASGDSAEAAARWLRKRYDDAIRQARGTKRTIAQRRQRNDPVRAVAVRALDFTAERRDEFAVPLDADPATWPIVVVLDHPGAAGVTMPPQENVFAITFDDWCELNRAVRSVNGLVQYVQRVLDAGTALDVPLGREVDRFRHVAATDAAYAAQRPGSLPWFTLDVARDRLGVKVYRELLERVWTGDARGAELTAAECRLVLDHLDNAPIGLQSRIGEWIFGKRDRLSTTGYRQSGVTVLDNGLLLYVCDSETNEPDRQMWAAELTALAAARRCAWREQRGAATAALAVGVRECTVGVEYTYVYLDGDIDISADLRAAVEGRYGTPSFTSR